MPTFVEVTQFPPWSSRSAAGWCGSGLWRCGPRRWRGRLLHDHDRRHHGLRRRGGGGRHTRECSRQVSYHGVEGWVGRGLMDRHQIGGLRLRAAATRRQKQRDNQRRDEQHAHSHMGPTQIVGSRLMHGASQSRYVRTVLAESSVWCRASACLDRRRWHLCSHHRYAATGLDRRRTAARWSPACRQTELRTSRRPLFPWWP
jgi:hypothetical protein